MQDFLFLHNTVYFIITKDDDFMGEKDLTFEMIPLRIMTILLEVLEHFLRKKLLIQYSRSFY